MRRAYNRIDARIGRALPRFQQETVMANARIILVLAIPLLLAGCASMRDEGNPSPTASRTTVEQDSAYIQRVEQQARIRGIGVTWVNPPIKRTRTAATPR